MSTLDIGENSIRLAKWHRDTPPTVHDLENYEGMITKACRHYLIGKICDYANRSRRPDERVIDVLTRIGQHLGYTGRSLKMFVTSSRSMDHLFEIAPDVASNILSGKARVTYRNVTILAKMNLPNINMVAERIACEKTPVTVVLREEKERPKIKGNCGRPKGYSPVLPHTTVKDIPPYDPDSQVVALSFTIPSWISAVDKVFMCTDFRKISQTARDKLKKEMTELKDLTDSMITVLSE